VVAVYLIIDAVDRTVYTRSLSTNSYVSASLDPISPPATDVAVIISSDPGDEPSSTSAPPIPTTPPSASVASEPMDAPRHPVGAPLTPCFDKPSLPLTSVPPEVRLSGPDTAGGQLVAYTSLKF